MPQAVEKAEQISFLPDQAALDQPSAGPVESPPALLDSNPSLKKGEMTESTGSEGAEVGGAQLYLPLVMDPEPEAERVAVGGDPSTKAKAPRPRTKGFVPVTRDPDVARSYSDNVALDYAIARGLAQALSSLPPQELAALKAKVARARQTGKVPSSRQTR